jgi:hypothetical protein
MSGVWNSVSSAFWNLFGSSSSSSTSGTTSEITSTTTTTTTTGSCPIVGDPTSLVDAFLSSSSSSSSTATAKNIFISEQEMKEFPFAFEEDKELLALSNWVPTQTAVIVCDLWDKHWCKSATQRIDGFIEQTNSFLHTLRSAGYTIVHCPADVVTSFYADHPCRLKTLATINNEPVPTICRKPIPPVPLSLGNTNGCMDWPPCSVNTKAWTRENANIDICDQDYIGDTTDPIRLLKALNIKNVIITGTALNICVIERDYGARALVSQGFSVVVVSDLTDVMYNDKSKSRAQATQIVVDYIRKNICSAVPSRCILAGLLSRC